ncbi:MAG: hypothetical protein GDA67_16685 [Nitrospira sp. CR1.3]|nr:hypothetical protein [Nitrospira sp. CR1.3]
MSESVYEESDICQLPSWGIVALAARCGRLALPFFDYWKDPSRRYLSMIETKSIQRVIHICETVAATGDESMDAKTATQKAANTVFEIARRRGTAELSTDHEHFQAQLCCKTERVLNVSLLTTQSTQRQLIAASVIRPSIGEVALAAANASHRGTSKFAVGFAQWAIRCFVQGADTTGEFDPSSLELVSKSKDQLQHDFHRLVEAGKTWGAGKDTMPVGPEFFESNTDPAQYAAPSIPRIQSPEAPRLVYWDRGVPPYGFVSALPRWVLVALAARCGQRAMRVVKSDWLVKDVHDAGDQLMQLVEEAAARKTVITPATPGAESAYEVVARACHHAPRPASRNALFAVYQAAGASMVEWPRSNSCSDDDIERSKSNLVGEVTGTILATIEALKCRREHEAEIAALGEDVLSISAMSKARRWTDVTEIPRKTFPPLADLNP